MAPGPTPFDPEKAVTLEAAFFSRGTATVARGLLGAVVASVVDGRTVAGEIVETEAYLGADDPGSHAATKGITARNAVMYGPPGCAYVYFTYGMHHMLNIVCEPDGVAGAVLLRAIDPVFGIEVMRERRGQPDRALADGPGKLAQALGVDLSDDGTALGAGRLQVYSRRQYGDAEVETTGRVGLSAGGDLPLRFLVRGHPAVSRGRPSG